ARFRSRAESAMPMDAAFAAAVIAAAHERPLLLVLDDAQWLDAASLAALPALARDTAPHRVLLLLGVARGAPDGERFDVLQARLGRDLEGALIRLGRLDQAALADLVAWAVPGYGADQRDRLVRRVERDTAGIPLLAVALVEAVAAGYQLAPDAPAWPSAARTLIDSLPGSLPPAVVGAVCLRFRGLPLAAQHVLGAAAALGGRGDVKRLARATGLEPGPVAQALDVLEWERWLSADTQGYVFAAPIERDIVLQEMLTPGQVPGIGVRLLERAAGIAAPRHPACDRLQGAAGHVHRRGRAGFPGAPARNERRLSRSRDVTPHVVGSAAGSDAGVPG